MSDPLIYREVHILGLVQGVAFRYYGKMKGQEIGVLGTIQNLSDGSVLARIAGNLEQVQAFIAWCHIGSPASSVQNVIVTELSSEAFQHLEDFIILRE